MNKMEHEERYFDEGRNSALPNDNRFDLTGWPYVVPEKDQPYQGVSGPEGSYAQGVEVVDKPPHYTQGGIECIDAIQAALTEDEFRGYCKGQAIAYLWRERFKGGDTDIAKAGWYCRRLAK